MGRVSAGCVANDLIWETFAWGAEQARRFGYREEALEHWRMAAKIAETFDTCDPRRAGTADSLGVFHRLAGDLGQAERMHRQALEQWKCAMDWVAEMPIALKPSSVTYHRGLQERFRGNLIDIARHHTIKLVCAGEAASRNNLACVLMSGDRWSDAGALLAQAPAAWCASIGARDEGLANIHRNRSMLFDREARPELAAQARALAARILADPSPLRLNRFARDCDRRMTPQRRLMAAVYLATGPQPAATVSMNRSGDAMDYPT
jgi:hypothetical protein